MSVGDTGGDMMNDNSMPLGLVNVTSENLDACVEHLNNRLMSHGVTSLPLNLRSTDDNDRIQVVSCLMRLLHQRHGDMDARDKLHDRLSRLQSDNESLSSNLKKSRSQLVNKTHEYEVLRVRYNTYQKEARQMQKKLQEENERMQLRVRDFQQKVVQYEHSMQRMEREGNRLKERMQRLVIDKGSSRARMDVINDVPPPPMRNWKHGQERNENTLYQNIVGAYEDEKQELVRENYALREALQRLNNEINHLRNAAHEKRGDQEFETRVAELKPGQFYLPYNIVKPEIEGTAMAKIEELLNATVTEEEKELLMEEKRNLAQQREDLQRFASQLDNERSKLDRERRRMDQLKQIEEFDRDIDLDNDDVSSILDDDDDNDDDDYGILSPSNLRQMSTVVTGSSASTAQLSQIARELRNDFNEMLMGDDYVPDDDDDDDDAEMTLGDDDDYGLLEKQQFLNALGQGGP